jgi:hypothetical protein
MILYALTQFSHTCSDPAVKQIMLVLDKQSSTGGFIVKDVDDTHVLVRADDVKRIRIALDAEVRVVHGGLYCGFGDGVCSSRRIHIPSSEDGRVIGAN